MTQSAQSISHPSQRQAVAGDAGESRKRGLYERAFKGFIDRIVGLVLAILTLPVVIPVAIAVFIDLGLPIFLRQERVGLNGKVFKVGSKKSFVAESSGVLQFAVAMQHQYANQNYQYPGQYNVRVRVQPQ